jgi:2,3-bisphosphoglycerate-dependent phosphoglycerate mutase
MTNVYLIRHADSDWTPDENRPLSSTGEIDSLRVAGILSNFPITKIISSPYLRARQTVAPLARRMGLDILLDKRFRERELGDTGDLSFKDAIYETWSNTEFAFPNGESIFAAQRRALAGLEEYLFDPDHGSLCISSHGNLLTCILNHFDHEIGYTFWESLDMPDIYRLKLDQDGESRIDRIWQAE